MKKNAAIVVLLTATLLSFGFAYNQRQLATEYKLLAIENEIMAHESMQEALHQKEIAEQSRMEAERQRQIAEVSRLEAINMKELADTERMRAMKNEEQARMMGRQAEQARIIAEANMREAIRRAKEKGL